jgi:hypothetical protein
MELDFGKQIGFNNIQVCFDTNLNINDAHLNDYRPGECIRDYLLRYYDGSRWKVIMHVRNNILRSREHRFDPVEGSTLRLTVQSTHGDRSARIFEIRAYYDSETG